MRISARLIRVVFVLFLLIFMSVSADVFGQKGNKPRFKRSQKESLGEKDNSFGGSKKFGFKGLFKKKGSGKQKKTTKYTSHKKKTREGFYKKKYTGKKSIFGKKKGHSWGGKAFKKNGKEDKRLFKASGGKGKYKKKKK